MTDHEATLAVLTICNVFDRYLGITFGEDGEDAEAAWNHLRRIMGGANGLVRDPNAEKSGYAPRKHELATQVVALGQLCLELQDALRKAERG